MDLCDNEINNLLELCLKYQLKNDNNNNDKLFDENELINVHPNLLQQFEEIFNHFNYNCFVKTSFKSSKKSRYGIFPCRKSVDIINNLIHCTDVLYSLLRPNIKLIFTEWNYDIKKENEFRLFIFNGKLKNICQNFPSIHMNRDFDEKYVEKIIEFWKEKHNEMIRNEYYASDYVMDIYVTDEKIGLIEINSGGKWSTCSSSLFDYNDMRDYEFVYIY